MQHPDHNLIALGVRQPWAELIIRGQKTLEVRSTGTRVRGPIYLYASKKPATIPAAMAAARRFELALDELQTGQIIGTVEIVEAVRCQPQDARRRLPAESTCPRQVGLATGQSGPAHPAARPPISALRNLVLPVPPTPRLTAPHPYCRLTQQDLS